MATKALTHKERRMAAREALQRDWEAKRAEMAAALQDFEDVDVFEVYQAPERDWSMDGGRDGKVLAHFQNEQDAQTFTYSSEYSSVYVRKLSFRVYRQAVDVALFKVEQEKVAALAKLSDHEKKLLGLA